MRELKGPFEAIVDVVNALDLEFPGGKRALCELEAFVVRCRITGNYDAIAEAFTKKFDFFGETPRRLLIHLAAEQTRVAAEAAKEAAKKEKEGHHVSFNVATGGN